MGSSPVSGSDASDSVSPSLSLSQSLSAPPPLVLSLSLSKINIKKKCFLIKMTLCVVARKMNRLPPGRWRKEMRWPDDGQRDPSVLGRGAGTETQGPFSFGVFGGKRGRTPRRLLRAEGGTRPLADASGAPPRGRPPASPPVEEVRGKQSELLLNSLVDGIIH